MRYRGTEKLSHAHVTPFRPPLSHRTTWCPFHFCHNPLLYSVPLPSTSSVNDFTPLLNIKLALLLSSVPHNQLHVRLLEHSPSFFLKTVVSRYALSEPAATPLRTSSITCLHWALNLCCAFPLGWPTTKNEYWQNILIIFETLNGNHHKKNVRLVVSSSAYQKKMTGCYNQHSFF